MKRIILLSVGLCLLWAQPVKIAESRARLALQYDSKIPQLVFAAQEIEREAQERAVANDVLIVMAAGAGAVRDAAAKWQVAPLKYTEAQSYALRQIGVPVGACPEQDQSQQSSRRSPCARPE